MTGLNESSFHLSATADASDSRDYPSDDDLAATQQSILEELHTISEEALMGTPDHKDSRVEHHPRDQYPKMGVEMDIEAVESSNSNNQAQQLDESRLPSQQHTEPALPLLPPGKLSPSLSTPPAIEADIPAQQPPNLPSVEANAEQQVIVSTENPSAESEREANGKVEDGQPMKTEVDAALVAVESLPELSGSLGSAPRMNTAAVDLPLLANSQLDAVLEIDHADLFDGIEADAFDDIELSPPTRRTIPLPSFQASISQMHPHIPASPTRSRNQVATQSLAEATFDTEGTAADGPLELPSGSQMTSFLNPGFVGFQTGRKKQITLSEKGMQAARKLLLELEESTDLLPPPQASQSLLQTRIDPIGSSSQAAPSSVNGRSTPPALARVPMQEIIPRQTNVAPNASGRNSPEAKGKAITPSAPQTIPPPQVVAASQVERHPFATPRQTRGGLIPTAQSMASPLRTPAASSGSRTTPQPSKRISLGMLRGPELGANSTGRKRSMPRFVTPFKGGKRPRADDPQDPASPLRRVNDGTDQVLDGASLLPLHRYPPTQTQRKQKNTLAGPAVFSMQSDSPRHKLAEVGRPEYYSSLQMIAKGVPDEVLVILKNASRAAQYAFEGPDGSLLMQKQALEELQARGCSAVEMPWIQNHWTLILWKLAAMVRLEPSSAPQRWSWNELIRQLLYRYEREVHLAQRSCIKRIQEHDSSPASPMVLFISKIFEEDTEEQDRSGQIVARKIIILELSDGWYRMQAKIDPVLTNACQRGRVSIGQKLSIMGATLDAQGEGKDVLAAYPMTSLVLAANSVSLARWDAKLGFSSTPFCASSRSLTAEGGLVSLMDVVIDRVYPRAYVDVDRSASSNQNAPRGEQEEAEEREAYAKRREDAIQHLELNGEAESRKLYGLVEALSDLTDDSFLPTIPDDPSGRLESFANQIFDQLRAQPNPAAAVHEKVVKAGHKILVPWLHNLAKSAILTEDGFARSNLAAQLDHLCPPRKVREFQEVRLRDARLPPPPESSSTAAQQGGGNGARPNQQKKNPYARTVLLKIWDAAKLGDELREGRRFLVTNLVPSSKSAWRKADEVGDIFLSTRRDTKWKPLS